MKPTFFDTAATPAHPEYPGALFVPSTSAQSHRKNVFFAKFNSAAQP
jgi:hypothetical protein